ncbi:MAG: 50S ribosomal protein L24 [Chloroflexi bacterium]|nr:50S ribosomal protein L24 [Chloroflexota bacterium]MCL5109927.1 50S ribosomal protein L24 [Chloroflexota bacterium]
MRITKNDAVLVIAGKDRGKTGKVRQVMPDEGKLIVEGVNIIKRHTKPQGTARQAGIVEREAPLDIAKVMLVCARCSKPTRVGYKVLEDGSRVRVCRSCHEVIG